MANKAFLAVCVFVITGAACSKKKAEQVFPEESSQSSTQACQEARIAGEFVALWEDGRVSLEHGESREQMLRDFVEPNLERLKRVDFNSRIQRAEALTGSVVSKAWHHERIQSGYAWERGFRGQGVVVAVIDSGVDISHPGLSERIFINAGEKPNNGIDDDGNGLVDDYQGYDFFADRPIPPEADAHGTHVAGIIAAQHPSVPSPLFQGEAYGIAPDSQILPIRFIGEDGSGSLFDAIRSIDYAARMGAHIINASWGASFCSISLYDKIKEAEEFGVLFVAASGNSAMNTDFFPEYPAAFQVNNIMSVAAASPRGGLANFSNFGLSSVDIAAPGEDIYSLFPGNQSGYLSGTSMAAPLVAGLAAILKSAKPEANYREIRDAIEFSSVPSQFAVRTRGRIDVEFALRYLLR